MEIFEKRLAANRLNSQKSTGPNTDRGKRMSSRNRTRHGILARTILVDDEDRDRFADLLNSLTVDLRPQNDTQRGLVEKMAVASWRTKRVWAVEAAAIRHETRRQADSTVDEDPPTRTMKAMRNFSDNNRHPDVWGRYETRYDRAYYKALATLTRMQNKENATRTHLTPLSSSQPQILEPTLSAVEATTEPVGPTQGAVEPTENVGQDEILPAESISGRAARGGVSHRATPATNHARTTHTQCPPNPKKV